jgi:demethylmenaquinone methyltransferase/2-methoxy-6-polyprenyl-1,4-benzoquinol methylase
LAKRIWDDASLGRVHEVADKAQRVQAMFDGIVRRYERVNTVTTLGLDATWRRRLVKGLELPAGAAVLDIACGTGQVLRRIARTRPEAAQLVGVDFSDVMIRHARWAGPEVASFCRADALRLPFAEGSFDAVTCAFGVRNFADPAAGLSEMFRVLRPGSVAGILEFSMPRTAVLGSLYRFYFRRVLPRLASWLCRDASGAYQYLQRSVETFTAVDLAAMMSQCGFEAPRVRQLTLGVVHLYTARKPTGDRR